MNTQDEIKEISDELQDLLHPLANLSSITILPGMTSIEDDIKRKGMMSEIVRRLTSLEERVRKIEARG